MRLMPVYDSPVLILEQSPVVTKQLVRYLSRLGFKQIFPFNDVKKALTEFYNLVEKKHDPLVFLAFDHGETNAISILPKFYQISTNTRVIVETARNRNDDCIRQLIFIGVFYFVAKPFYFEDIEKVISIIQNDDDILADFMEKDKEFLIKILDTVQRISVNRLSEITKLSKDKIANILNHLKKENRIMIMGTINEAMCESCNSVQISPVFFCKACMSSNFVKQRLIEHMRCGNVGFDRDYSDEKCPSCQKK